MDFFKQIAALGNVDMAIKIYQKNEKLTIAITPGVKSTIQPIVCTGTPEELDNEFFTAIAPAAAEVAGIVHNIQDVKKQAEDEKEKKEKPKSAPTKTAAAKKQAVTKKVPVKKEKGHEPDLFAADEEAEEGKETVE